MKTLRDLIDSLPRGLDTPVLGELPVTADGAIAMIGELVFNPHQNIKVSLVAVDSDGQHGALFGSFWRPFEFCYSAKKAAAERAAKESK